MSDDKQARNYSINNKKIRAKAKLKALYIINTQKKSKSQGITSKSDNFGILRKQKQFFCWLQSLKKRNQNGSNCEPKNNLQQENLTFKTNIQNPSNKLPIEKSFNNKNYSHTKIKSENIRIIYNYHLYQTQQMINLKNKAQLFQEIKQKEMLKGIDEALKRRKKVQKNPIKEKLLQIILKKNQKFKMVEINEEKSKIISSVSFDLKKNLLRKINSFNRDTFLNNNIELKSIDLNHKISCREQCLFFAHQNNDQKLLYILGGRGYKKFGNLYQYNINLGEIKKIQLIYNNKKSKLKFYGNKTFVIWNLVYIIGGCCQFISNKQFYKFNSQVATINLDNFKVEFIDSLYDIYPQNRFNHACCQLSNKYILLSGGQNFKGQILNDLWVFDVNEKVWMQLNQNFFGSSFFQQGIFKHTIFCVEKDQQNKQIIDLKPQIQAQIIQDSRKLNQRYKFKKQIAKKIYNILQWDLKQNINIQNTNSLLKNLSTQQQVFYEHVLQKFYQIQQNYKILTYGGLNGNHEIQEYFYRLCNKKSKSDSFNWVLENINSDYPNGRFNHNVEKHKMMILHMIFQYSSQKLIAGPIQIYAKNLFTELIFQLVNLIKKYSYLEEQIIMDFQTQIYNMLT